MNKSTKKFVLVGCGNIGRKHFGVISSNPHAEVVAVVDIKNKEEIPVDLGEIPYFNTLEDFFNSGIKADVINIATPNYLHSSQTLESLHHGYHVVLEKPVALTTEDAHKICEAETQFHKKVFVVMQNRYSPLSI